MFANYSARKFSEHQDEQLHSVVVKLLDATRRNARAGRSPAPADTSPAGFTDVPGASAVFLCGLAGPIANDARRNKIFWASAPETLAQHGAVSEPVALKWPRVPASGLTHDYALSVTGIAGPDGGTTDKPVGTVFIALATARHTFVLNPINRFDRETFKLVTCQQALDLLRRMLLKGPPKELA